MSALPTCVGIMCTWVLETEPRSSVRLTAEHLSSSFPTFETGSQEICQVGLEFWIFLTQFLEQLAGL